MSREQILINEIRDMLNKLESLLNRDPDLEITYIEPTNFRILDSTITINGTKFQITSAQRIELCKFVVNNTTSQINIKPFVETIDTSRCNCYCIVKEIDRREKFLSEGENLYYDESKNKYYSQCRMPSIKNNNNNCNRHTGSPQIDVSRMKILTNSSYNLSLDSSIKEYCKMYLESNEPKLTHVSAPKPAPVEKPIPVKKPVPVKKPIPVKTPPVKKFDPVEKPTLTPVPAPKLIESENSDIDSSSESESVSEAEVDMIVSKVIETLKPVPSPAPSPNSESESESESDAEDSDDCMLDADEIHDEEGNTYYIDEAKSVIKLDEDGYGVRLGMLKEFKSGNLFYKNKRWKIDYFPKK
jgi:hypothetical protein